jgi:hypothetical protein
MKKHVLAVYIICLMFASCNLINQPYTPLKMNNYLVGISASLHDGGYNWGQKFVEANKTKDYASLKPERMALEKTIDDKLPELEKMTDIGGSKEFRIAMINFLVMEKKMIHDGMLPIENLGKDTKQEDAENEINKLREFFPQEESSLDGIRIAQAKFAKRNNFKIVESKK